MKKIVLLLLVLSVISLSAAEMKIGSYFNLNVKKMLELKDDMEIDQLIQESMGSEGAMVFQMYKGIEMQVKSNVENIEAVIFVSEDGVYDFLLTLKAPEGSMGLEMYIGMAFIAQGDHYVLQDQFKQNLTAMNYNREIVLSKVNGNYLLASNINYISSLKDIKSSIEKLGYSQYIKMDKNVLMNGYSNTNLIYSGNVFKNDQFKEMEELMKEYINYVIETFTYSASYVKYNRDEHMIYIKGESVNKDKKNTAESYAKFPSDFFKYYAKMLGSIMTASKNVQEMQENTYSPTEEEMQMMEDYNYN